MIVPNDFNLLDASLARAREGLRVLDETARFILQNQQLYLRIRTLRHRLVELEQRLGPAHLMVGRTVDVGARMPPSQHRRASLWDSVRANAGRVSESLRTLEEWVLLFEPPLYGQCTALRYEVYAIEKMLLLATPHFWLRYFFEQGIVYPLSSDALELIDFIRKGARVVQVRDKDGNRNKIAATLTQLLHFISEFEKKSTEKIVLIVNDDPELVAHFPVAGVHIVQDYPVGKARRMLGSNKIIGRSNANVEQMKQSLRDGADYVSLGPIFPTVNKPERTAVGLASVAQAAREIMAPWVAIGGIGAENFSAVYEAGARNMAMIRGAREFFK